MDYSSIIAILSLAITGAGTSIGIYVKFNNELTLAKYRISTLEKSNDHLISRVDGHEDKIGRMFNELKEDIHDLRILIEQNKTT